jgi:hypothetical protein
LKNHSRRGSKSSQDIGVTDLLALIADVEPR